MESEGPSLTCSLHQLRDKYSFWPVMNQTHTTDFEGQPNAKPVFVHFSLLAATMAACSALFLQPVFLDAAFSLSTTPPSPPPPLHLSLPPSLSLSHSNPFFSLCGFSFTLPRSPVFSLWPIFCLIAPISSTSHCPNSESVNFNLRDRLVGMMYSLSCFAAGHAQ